MWAMIATCIALGVWAMGLLYLTNRAEKKALVDGQGGIEAPRKGSDNAIEVGGKD